jgi:hypothetical protein
LGTFTPDDIEELLPGEIDPFLGNILVLDYTVEQYQVLYETIDPQGQPTQASGVMSIPINSSCNLALASYEHGTMSKRSDAPSMGLNGEGVIPLTMASEGYIGLAPDYLGLGLDNTRLHPYMHAASEASASIDLIRAAKSYCAANDIPLNGQLFIMGYSQGGHAAMATHREIQLYHSDEMVVTASSPMAGPHDVSGVQAGVLISDQPYPAPAYAPYVLMSYRSVYPDLAAFSFEDIFIDELEDIIPNLLDGNHGLGEIEAMLPTSVPRDMFEPALFADFESDPNHPLWLALRDNDLLDWVPTSPIRMIHCGADMHVPVGNSEVALETFVAQGADPELIEFINPNDAWDHGACAAIAIVSGKSYFDSYLLGCEEVVGLESASGNTAYIMEVYPNPIAQTATIRFNNPESEQFTGEIIDLNGKVVQTLAPTSASEINFSRQQLAGGLYFVQLRSANHTLRTKISLH